MTHVRTSEPGPIRFERVYDAPDGDLWALWTTKEGLEEWFASGQDDTAALCDPNAGVPIRWVEGVGWVTE